MQVRTLRATPTRPRTIIGEIKRPCDVILALRPAWDYTPTEAIEIPVDVAEQYVGKNSTVGWTRALAGDPRVTSIACDAPQRPAGNPL